MNVVIDAIWKRRSVRSYEPRQVQKDIIRTIIDAGNEAPSAMNSQPWRFVVVEDANVREKLIRAALPKAQRVLDMVRDTDPERYELIRKRYAELRDPVYYTAPAIIFVIGSGPYADHSCPLACENMMLAAYSLGLGSCWVGFGAMVTEDPDIRGILALQDEEKIFGPILLGYPQGSPERPPKKAPRVIWI